MLSSPSDIIRINWGLIDYQQALEKQQRYLAEVVEGKSPQALVVCTHPATVTLGRATTPDDIFGWTGATVEVTRGGRATYHGPSQVVIYPIVRLDVRGRDIHSFIRKIEVSIVSTLKFYAIESRGNPAEVIPEASPELQATGVWVGSRKVAAIGIAVRKWVSFHGLAVNLENDPTAFQGIKPCGFAPGTPISIEEIIGKKIDRNEFTDRLVGELIGHL